MGRRQLSGGPFPLTADRRGSTQDPAAERRSWPVQRGEDRHGQGQGPSVQGAEETEEGKAQGDGHGRAAAGWDRPGQGRQGLSAAPDWSAARYLRFADERTRPAGDLIARIPTAEVTRAVDLGCGPGNSTDLLAARFPGARIVGIDSSPDMLAAARRRLPGARFEEVDIAAWADPGPFDVILANASLQWVPDHARLLPSLLARLAAGGSLAVQMPDNLDEPSHRLMREVATEGPWRAALAGAATARATRREAAWYWRLLRETGAASVDIWRTTYLHPLAGPDAIVDWLKSTGLRPFLAPLGAGDAEAFLARYRAALAGAYPAESDGSVLLAFPRLFFIAVRGAADPCYDSPDPAPAPGRGRGR
jgi:trans-aconitate 2-methyltransferase